MKVPAFWHSFSIFQKLMLTFLSLTILLLASTLFLARWSFEQGFLDYVNALEQTRLEIIEKLLIKEYIKAGQDWHKIPQEHLNVIISSIPVPQRGKGARDPEFNLPMKINGHLVPHTLVLPGRGKKVPETALFDSQDEFVTGSYLLLDRDIPRVNVPIKLNGRYIGTLRSIPVRHFDETLPTQHSKRQWESIIWVGVIGLLIAITISWLLALLLSRSLKEVMNAVARLSSGDYSISLKSREKDEIGQLVDNVNILAKTLDSSRESRRHWLACISHDLRTPITILAGEIQALKDGVREFNQDRLLSLEQEVCSLRKLTDDLYQLSISDIGGLRYEFAETDLNALLLAIISTYNTAATDYGLKLEFDGEAVAIFGDTARLSQLFSNILSNSIAYTDSPGKIHIKLSKQKGFALVEIDDSEPGVPKSLHDKLFDPLFRQDESRNRRKEGSGLGLAICLKIVEAHKGQISALKSDLGGLKLVIKVPLFKE